MKVPIFFLSPVKGVGLLIPIFFLIDNVAAMVGFGFKKGLGNGGRGNSNGWKGDVTSWSTGLRLEKKKESESARSSGNRSLSGSLWVDSNWWSRISMSSWGSKKAVLSASGGRFRERRRRFGVASYFVTSSNNSETI